MNDRARPDLIGPSDKPGKAQTALPRLTPRLKYLTAANSETSGSLVLIG